MAVVVLFLKRVITVDPAGGPRLHHGCRRADVAGMAVGCAEFFEHPFLPQQQILCHIRGIGRIEFFQIFRMMIPVKGGLSARQNLVGKPDVAMLHGPSAAFQRDFHSGVGEIIPADYDRHSGAAQNVGVTGRVDEDLRSENASPGFIFNDESVAVFPVHQRPRYDGVEHELDSGVTQIFGEGIGEDLRGEQGGVSDFRISGRSAVPPSFRDGVVAVPGGEADKFVHHAAHDFSPSAVAHRNEPVDEPDGRQPAE